MQIRPMTPGDFAAFWPIFRDIAAARETYAFDPDMGQEDARALWFEAPLESWLAEEDGAILGSYFLKANAAGPGGHVGNCGYMVAPAARGKGVARAMCEHSQRRARARGFLALQFNSVVATNEAAVALWQKLGFDIVGRLPRAYRHAAHGLVDCLVMYKWLEDEPRLAMPEPVRLIGRKNIEATVSRRRKRE
ncbi:GNAT family N-acetyltransferase [Chromobacterium phragmitis]|uniref:GNAT family N-acetyltransferase n=1 Tax=Chromobacterium phragmitis TaxID=2202141 RepID=A0A344UIG7_9NEIS|nr:N-acetyltransferase [Chromobacterium phragmitis]AXE29674.1 GNAT family N-acetyltransferase [Chromobacterium phragmitis]AXE35065.1 GNAT family N-acetyltransferase [Chromobacterium phragmitis]